MQLLVSSDIGMAGKIVVSHKVSGSAHSQTWKAK